MKEADSSTQSEESPRRKTRSKAQQEASRANGRKSRGPATPAGKARSAANAMADGLLARQFMPPADYRQLDVLYRQLRHELRDEFQPRTFSKNAAIDSLAHDYMRLVRAHEIIEVTAVGAAKLDASEDQRYRWTLEAKRDLEISEPLLRLQGRPEGPLCDRDEAWRLAQIFRKTLEAVAAARAAADTGFDASGQKLAPMEDIDLEFDAQHRQLLATLGDAEPKLRNQEYVVSLLTGKGLWAEEDWTRVRALLVLIVNDKRFYIRGRGEEVLEKVATIKSQNLLNLAAKPEAYLRAEQYARDLERIIQQKLDRLRR